MTFPMKVRVVSVRRTMDMLHVVLEMPDTEGGPLSLNCPDDSDLGRLLSEAEMRDAFVEIRIADG